MQTKCTIPRKNFKRNFPRPLPYGASILAPWALDLNPKKKILDPPVNNNNNIA